MTDMSGAFGSRWRNLGIAATAWVGFLPAPTALAADLSTAPVASDYNFVDLKWGPWVELGGTYGTEESSYGEAAVFAPLMQGPDWLAFTEIRGKYFEGDLLEGNAMLGYRKMTGFRLQHRRLGRA
jgi:hypothetical protein